MKQFFLLFAALCFLPAHRDTPDLPTTGACDPGAPVFGGYTFLLPDIVNKNAAYAPFFTTWDDYYERYYFSKDLQREDNITEWIERFCGLPLPADVEYVVYQATENELLSLRDVAVVKGEAAQLPYTMGGNTFAEVLAYNGCTEALDYLVFAKQCEPHVVAYGDGWARAERDKELMLSLIEEGKARFLATRSHFFRLRYAYQIVRLAHYAGQWQLTVDLYNYLLPKFDRKKPSIVYFWTLGHLAGALQQLGKTADAAYRYSLVFRYCKSKRVQAFRSFRLSGEAEWARALRMCQNDVERATIYLLRAGTSRTYLVEDLETIYLLDPESPHLELMLVGIVQQLERVFLRTTVTERKYTAKRRVEQREAAAKRLINLQKLVRRVAKDGHTPNPLLWRAMTGYLELLAGDGYAAQKSLELLRGDLKKNEDYDQILLRQLDVWELLREILDLDGTSASADQVAYRIRSYDTFKTVPSFEPFLQDFLSARYAESAHPGKAILAAYTPAAIRYNPRPDVLDDLLQVARSSDPTMLEHAMQIDTNPNQIIARLLEIKGAYLFSVGQPEAALSVLRQIPGSEDDRMPKFSPFKEVFDEKIHRPITDTLLLTRREIVEKLMVYEFHAKAAVAMKDPVGSWYFYLCGLGYYNMSYFGYEWEAMDFYRSGHNWNRLAQGPIFPLVNSPHGNRENTDISLALGFFEKALAEARNPELAARAAFMAARCQQKQWFCHPDCTYRPGSRFVPVLPAAYRGYYDRLKRYENADFYKKIVQECKWLPYYQ
ncbi:MAG: hypothetical protein ABMA02_08860 [Saprospiraceae bacterium]